MRNYSLKMGISTTGVPNADIGNPVCKHCMGKCVKAGKERSGKQRYRCTNCNRRQFAFYDKLAYNDAINENIIAMNKRSWN